MTKGDKNVNSLFSLLLTLIIPRTDEGSSLANPADSGIAAVAGVPAVVMLEQAEQVNLPLFLHTALKTDLETSLKSAWTAIVQKFGNTQTRADALSFVEKVQNKIS